MPALPSLQSLQRELADCIIRGAPLDEIRILLACGAKVNEPVTQGNHSKPFRTCVLEPVLELELPCLELRARRVRELLSICQNQNATHGRF